MFKVPPLESIIMTEPTAAGEQWGILNYKTPKTSPSEVFTRWKLCPGVLWHTLRTDILLLKTFLPQQSLPKLKDTINDMFLHCCHCMREWPPCWPQWTNLCKESAQWIILRSKCQIKNIHFKLRLKENLYNSNKMDYSNLKKRLTWE